MHQEEELLIESSTLPTLVFSGELSGFTNLSQSLKETTEYLDL